MLSLLLSATPYFCWLDLRRTGSGTTVLSAYDTRLEVIAALSMTVFWMPKSKPPANSDLVGQIRRLWRPGKYPVIGLVLHLLYGAMAGIIPSPASQHELRGGLRIDEAA